MGISKFTLISHNFGYGPSPEYDEEIDQRLTINSKGQVWFIGYKYGDGNGKGPIARKKRLTITKSDAAEILLWLSQYLEKNGQLPLALDAAVWSLAVTETSGIQKEFLGSLCEDYLTPGNARLSARIRTAVSIENLYVFDGNPVNEQVNQ